MHTVQDDASMIQTLLLAATQGPDVRAAALRLAQARRAYIDSKDIDADRSPLHDECGAAWFDLLVLVEDRFTAAEKDEALS